MAGRTFQQSICLAVLLTLLSACFPSPASAQQGQIIITTDVEMIGATSLSGGGHIHFTATGGVARDLREMILYHYDEDRDGNIDADEALKYSLDVQDYLENPPSGALGTDYRYGRIKKVSLDEGNTPSGIEESSTGLVDEGMSTTSSLSMTLRFTMETKAAKKTYEQDENVIMQAFYDVFSATASVNGPLDAQNATTGVYDNNTRMFLVDTTISIIRTELMSNPNRGRSSHLIRLNASNECFLNFTYNGSVADSGDYLVFQISEDTIIWNDVHNLTSANNTSQSILVERNLTGLGCVEFYLRLLFKSDSSGNSAGFTIDDLSVYGLTYYEGKVEMHHTDYLLGTLSFQKFDSHRGAVHLIRTPGGMILSYTSTFDANDWGEDTTTFVGFNFFENPQLLFILIFILTYLLLSFQTKFYLSYKMAHPRRYRAGAVRIKWLHWLGKIFVLLYIIFYFFPSMFVFLGPRAYLTGVFMWAFSIASFLGLVITTKLLYDKKTMMIPPEVEEEVPVVVEAPVVAEALPPPTVHPTLACTVCMDEIADLREGVRCRCGQIYHRNCAAKVETCPACGNELDVGVADEKKMMTIKCSSCSEIVLVEEGVDLMRTQCENCGSVLKIVDRGYNHLMIDDTPSSAYEQFNSLLKQDVTGLVISTAYPEKLKRQISVENVELYWLTDTSSEHSTLNPKRLDFEIMRAISNFVKKAEGGAILLDGFEYLAVENGFDVTLKFMKKVNDLCSINDATLIVPITPLSLSPDQLSMLKKEFDRVEMFSAQPTGNSA